MAPTDDTTNTQVRLPRALWEAIKTRAEAEHRSANSLVVVLLEDAMGTHNAAHKNRPKPRNRQ
jgi:hypothetical protein